MNGFHVTQFYVNSLVDHHSIVNKIIKNNTKRIDKNLWTANDEGKDVELKQTYNDFEEAEFVAEKIIQLVKNEDLKYSDFSENY